MVLSAAPCAGSYVGRRLNGLVSFQIWLKEFRVKVFLIVLSKNDDSKKSILHNIYSVSEHFLPCELSEDCKQHSSHTCAVAGYGLSGAFNCFYNVCLF